MLPILLKVGPITVYSYGLFLVLAVFGGIFLIWRETREEFVPEKMLDLIGGVILGIIFGARLFYVLANFSQFGVNILKFLAIFWYPGLNFWGGVVGGGVVFWYWSKRWRWDGWRFLDLAVLGLVMALGLLSLGAFLGGVAWGKETGLPWGVNLVTIFGRRHPVQIYELVFLIFLFYFIRRLKNFYPQGEKPFAGFLFLVFLIFWSLAIWILGFFRDSQVFLVGLAPRQWLALGILTTALVIFYRRGERLRRIDKRFSLSFWWSQAVRRVPFGVDKKVGRA